MIFILSVVFSGYFVYVQNNNPSGGICHRTDKEITYVSNEVIMSKIGNVAQLYCCIINSDFLGWVFLDNKIMGNSKYSLSFNRENQAQILTINNVQESDSGTYFCRVNLNNREVRDFPVLMNIQAQISNNNPQFYLEISKTQRIPLQIIGSPFPTVHFYRMNSDVPLVENFVSKENVRNGRYEIASDGDIYIHNLVQTDSGKYVIRLIQGGSFLSEDYVIEIFVGARPFVAYVPQQFYNFTLGQNEILPARFSGSNLNIYWMFTSKTQGVKIDRITADLNEHYLVSVDGTLKVLKVVASDSGTYVGVCKNPWGEVQVKTSVVNIITPASITLLNNVVSSVGGNATLVVDIEGYPPPYISWWRNGVKIKSDRVDARSSELFLNMLTRNDAGIYTCIADNGASIDGVRTYAAKNVTLYIEGFPVMELAESSKTLIVTENRKIIELKCYVSGYPPSEIQFIKGNQSYSPTSQISGQMNSDKVEATLKMTVDKPYQIGIYICAATNSIGTSTLNIVVKNMTIPTPPKNLYIIQLDTNGVKIGWDIPASEFNNLSDYIFLTMLWVKSTVVIGSKNVNQNFVSFKSLKRNTVYHFNVRASNVAGWSVPSHTLTFKTPNVGRPSAPLVLNRDIFLPSNFIRLYWATPLDNGGDAVLTYGVRKCVWDIERIYLDTQCETYSRIRSNEMHFNGLLANQLYNFYVYAQNQINKSDETKYQVFSGPNSLVASPGPVSPGVIVSISIIATLFVILIVDVLLCIFFKTGFICWLLGCCFFFAPFGHEEMIPLRKDSIMAKKASYQTTRTPLLKTEPVLKNDTEIINEPKLEENAFRQLEFSDINYGLTEVLPARNSARTMTPYENYKYLVEHEKLPEEPEVEYLPKFSDEKRRTGLDLNGNPNELVTEKVKISPEFKNQLESKLNSGFMAPKLAAFKQSETISRKKKDDIKPTRESEYIAKSNLSNLDESLNRTGLSGTSSKSPNISRLINKKSEPRINFNKKLTSIPETFEQTETLKKSAQNNLLDFEDNEKIYVTGNNKEDDYDDDSMIV